MNNGSSIGGMFIVILGVVLIIARTQRWSWFNSHYKIQNVEDALGSKGNDILYWFIGLLIIVIGLLILLGVIG